MEEWFRKSELSCDRAGLLATQDLDAARRVLMKLAGGARLSELNADAFREQAHEYDAVPDLRDSVLKILQLRAIRTRSRWCGSPSLTDWVSSGGYERILGGDYPRRDTTTTLVGEEMRAAARSYQESWSRSEDPLVGMVRGVAEGAMRAGEGLFGRFGGRPAPGATATATTDWSGSVFVGHVEVGGLEFVLPDGRTLLDDGAVYASGDPVWDGARVARAR